MKFKDLLTPPLNRGEELLKKAANRRFNTEEEVDEWMVEQRRKVDNVRLDGETDGYIGAWGE